MSDVHPFRALRYARELTPRLAGPYDVISAAERAQLASEPENVVHLTLPPGAEGERDYASAAATLARWQREGVLVRDAEEQIYVLEEKTRDGRLRRGFLALLRLADYEQGVVLPHENTMPGPKRDRLALTRKVRANLEPLLFSYEDRDGKLDPVLDGARAEPALVEARGPDGTGLVLRGVMQVLNFSLQRPLDRITVNGQNGHFGRPYLAEMIRLGVLQIVPEQAHDPDLGAQRGLGTLVVIQHRHRTPHVHWV